MLNDILVNYNQNHIFKILHITEKINEEFLFKKSAGGCTVKSIQNNLVNIYIN
jgi:hypothetical protein